MYYKLDYKKLHTYIKKTEEQTKEWADLLDKINEALKAINSTTKITGSGADNIKAYFATAHGLILSNVMELVRMHLGNAQLYEKHYCDSVGMDPKTHVETKETENIIDKIEKQRKKNEDLTISINKTIKSIDDLVELTSVSADSISEARTKVQKHIKVLNRLINEIETEHSKSNFGITAQSIQRTKTLIISLQNSRSYPNTFNKNAFFSTKEFKEFYQSAVKVDNAYSANVEQYKNAYDSYQALEKLYVAEREKETELKRLALVVATTAIGIAVSALTAGVASPLVAAGVTAIVSAGSAAVTTAANKAWDTYVIDGDYENLDTDQMLRDAGKAAVIAGATSLMGSAVSAGVQSGMTTMISSHSIKTAGDVGLYGLTNSTAGRIGAGVVIGSVSTVAEGVTKRFYQTLADDVIEWDDTGVHLTKEKSISDSIETAAKKAFDPKELGKDAAYGGVSGGIKEQKAIRKEKYEASITKRENLKQEISDEELEYVETPKSRHKTSNAYKTNSKSEQKIISEMHESGEWDSVDYDDIPDRKSSILTKEIGAKEGWEEKRIQKNYKDHYQNYKNVEKTVKTATGLAGSLNGETDKQEDEAENLFDFKEKKIFTI